MSGLNSYKTNREIEKQVFSSSDVRATIPPIAQYFFFVIFISASFLGIWPTNSGSLVPVTLLLDFWLLALTTFSVVNGLSKIKIPALLLIAFSVLALISSLGSGALISDFALSYRWLLYTVVIILLSKYKWPQISILEQLAYFLVSLAIFKELLHRLTSSEVSRAGLLVENNFELPLYLGLLVLLREHISAKSFWLLLTALSILTFLEESRSGFGAFFLVLFFAAASSKVRTKQKIIILLSIGIPGAVGGLWVWAQRAPDSFAQIDRIQFFNIFLTEVESWSFTKWLFGNPPLTALTPSSCGKLSFYESAFSAIGDGTCYSVILHSFLLRVVFDSGVIGLLVAVTVPLAVMLKNKTPLLVALTLIGIGLANSLSVSGFNNPFVVIPFILATMTSNLNYRDNRVTRIQ